MNDDGATKRSRRVVLLDLGLPFYAFVMLHFICSFSLFQAKTPIDVLLSRLVWEYVHQQLMFSAKCKPRHLKSFTIFTGLESSG